MARPASRLSAPVGSGSFVRAANSHAAADAADRASLGQSRTVLLVFADGALRALLQRLLERAGHTALVARSADEGLSVMTQLRTRVDACVLDGVLAAATADGRAAMDRFLSTAPSLPLLVLGGRKRDIDVPRMTVHPGVWLPTPVEGDEVLAAIGRLVEAPASSLASRSS
jgi:CheY-like chemotaxis protein